MVLLRRRSDGLYYNGIRSNCQGRGWTDDIQKCLPYTSELGVRRNHLPWLTLHGCTCPTPNRWAKKNCQHVKDWMNARRAKFNAKYEIVPIRIEVVR